MFLEQQISILDLYMFLFVFIIIINNNLQTWITS